MSTTASPLAGTFNADPVHSNFGFAVRYQGVSLFKGTLDEVAATLTDGKLEGTAQVESISIRTPEQFRAHVLGGDDFFAAEQYPTVTFSSTSIDVAADNTVEVKGDLTIKDNTKPVVAKGTWVAPAPDAFGSTRAHLNLEAVIDRTEFGLTWNAPLPSGGKALANEVTLTIELALVEQA
ncbi:polyisoprenoid-binding protein YceI [Solirubrobacter pauli]|uniref:Polyisoprenoid-binding protein YceI n=1 Tax=Solirubrobacter pauli TaxID=166793 RepID=A0A660KVB8_9ACTN|nr:YceI family protein [Solirubrobacter pauli]RKQ84943.1 polyisoprenoid-binding protein YceI [Solirubrobacter pauli]